jgi:hypothetical protein
VTEQSRTCLFKRRVRWQAGEGTSYSLQFVLTNARPSRLTFPYALRLRPGLSYLSASLVISLSLHGSTVSPPLSQPQGRFIDRSIAGKNEPALVLGEAAGARSTAPFQHPSPQHLTLSSGCRIRTDRASVELSIRGAC